jgi:hypothetical protein
MPIFILTIIVQIALVVHVMKTGRNTMWIWAIVMLPAIGAIAYFFVEILPSLMQTRTGWQAKKGLEKLVNPNRDFKQASNNFEVVDTVENSSRLAAEYLEKGEYAEAKALYDKCLTGLYENDPDLLYARAQAEYGLEQYAETKHTLDTLIKENPQYKNVDAHLLYAKTLVKLGNNDLALKELEVLNETYPGPEATYRYAMLLKELGKTQQTQELLEGIMKTAKLSDKHYRARYKSWINLAKSELDSV